MGNQNMAYAKSKRANNKGAEIFAADELNKIESESGSNKRDQLAFLNRKVRQFEEKVARDEVLARNRNGGGFDGGSGSDAAF